MTQLYKYCWGNNEKRAGMKGRTCRVLSRGKKNSCSIEFTDNGQKEVVSRNALRKTIMDYESLYSTATKALITQIEINTKLQYKNKTLKKRAESAEEDWQVVEQIIDRLKVENKKLEQYKLYVETRISECKIPNEFLPLCFEEWDKVVEDLAKDLEQVVHTTSTRQKLKEHGIEYK